MSVKLFTHTDLDGVGCAILALNAFGDVSVTYCDYANVNEKISAYLDGEERHDNIYITDISVNDYVAERIDNDNACWSLFDHHATALPLLRYGWATVLVDIYGVKTSGTSLFNEYIRHVGCYTLDEFAEKVRSYDTWDWTLTGDAAAKDLNDLLYLIGRERFVERFTRDATVELTADERMLLDIERGRIDAYIRTKLRQLTIREIAGHSVGIVFADRYQSELGNFIVNERGDIDLVAMIDPAKGVSYRSKGGINVGEFAKQYGGGGHVNAAGSQVSEDQREQIVNIIFGGDR